MILEVQVKSSRLCCHNKLALVIGKNIWKILEFGRACLPASASGGQLDFVRHRTSYVNYFAMQRKSLA
jgi:hypothetical protein